MTPTILLTRLKERTEKALKDMVLPVSIQTEDEAPEERTPDVYLVRLPESRSYTKKAPYVLHQILTWNQVQPPGEYPEGRATVRSIFCTWGPNEEAAGLALVEMMERLYLDLLRHPILADQFQLQADREQTAPACLIYQEDMGRYAGGEMVTTWSLPPMEREVIFT